MSRRLNYVNVDEPVKNLKVLAVFALAAIFVVFLILFMLNVAVPDPSPVIDELGLGAGAAGAGSVTRVYVREVFFETVHERRTN